MYFYFTRPLLLLLVLTPVNLGTSDPPASASNAELLQPHTPVSSLCAAEAGLRGLMHLRRVTSPAPTFVL